MRAHPLLLALLVPFSASAQDVSWDVANTLGRAAMGAVSARDVRGRCVSCGEPDGPAERFAATLPGGFWGGGQGEPFMRLAQAGVTPVNLGFQALGPKGAAGRISGPGLLGFGDGAYTVLENSPFMVVLRMQTGYVNGRFVLKRDASSGLDVIGFAGHVMENGGWGPYKEGFNPGRVTYDAAADRGTVQWLVNGERREDRYERGGPGSRAMRITLNGHNHDFFRE
jgi:hypothetical protein